jgi:Haem-NO-binding
LTANAVHGLILISFLDFMGRRFGDGWSDSSYLASEAYADDEFRSLVKRASTATGRPRADLLREFGVFAATEAFAGLYPAYYAESADTRSFLLAVEERIHELVRNTIPGARPPRLNVRPLGEGDVCISYTSERGLCDLLEGLLVGTAQYYGETSTSSRSCA